MWSRKELKETAKQRVRMNYWKTVLAALAFAVLCGSGASVFSPAGAVSRMHDSGDSIQKEISNDFADSDDFDSHIDYRNQEDADIYLEDSLIWFVLVVIVIVFAIFIIALLIILPLNIFIFQPLGVGIRRFFIRNLREPSQIKEIGYAFDHGYKNCVKTEFFRVLYVFLWSLLFVIPGIVKSYEYQMIPYILAENPDIQMEDAFAQSKSMMYSNKWKVFILDLSFIGWYILNGCTLGILGVFYLNPYVEQTNAALYQTLKNQYLSDKYQEI